MLDDPPAFDDALILIAHGHALPIPFPAGGSADEHLCATSGLIHA